jgi:hypothetical protein
MKLGEMADLLSGLALALEKFMGKAAVSDLLAVAECFRRFPNDSTKAFCDHVIAARDGKPPSGRKAGISNEAEVARFVEKIQHFLQNRQSYDASSLRELAAQIGKLKVAEIQAVGAGVGCPLSGTKGVMVSRLGDWLANIKLSAEQSAFP